jgi:hypothetical protein
VAVGAFGGLGFPRSYFSFSRTMSGTRHDVVFDEAAMYFVVLCLFARITLLMCIQGFSCGVVVWLLSWIKDIGRIIHTIMMLCIILNVILHVLKALKFLHVVEVPLCEFSWMYFI